MPVHPHHHHSWELQENLALVWSPLAPLWWKRRKKRRSLMRNRWWFRLRKVSTDMDYELFHRTGK
jgi:hypothetical protein